MDGYEYAQERFFQEVPPQKLRSQLDTIIRTRDATPKTTAFCLHFLHDFLQVHPTSGKLGDDFGGHLVDLLWIVMRSGDSEDQYFAQRNANKLLKCVFNLFSLVEYVLIRIICQYFTKGNPFSASCTAKHD